MRSTSDDESIREPTPPPLRKSSPECKSPSPPATQHRHKMRQKVTMPGAKNSPDLFLASDEFQTAPDYHGLSLYSNDGATVKTRYCAGIWQLCWTSDLLFLLDRAGSTQFIIYHPKILQCRNGSLPGLTPCPLDHHPRRTGGQTGTVRTRVNKGPSNLF